MKGIENDKQSTTFSIHYLFSDTYKYNQRSYQDFSELL